MTKQNKNMDEVDVKDLYDKDPETYTDEDTAAIVKHHRATFNKFRTAEAIGTKKKKKSKPATEEEKAAILEEALGRKV